MSEGELGIFEFTKIQCFDRVIHGVDLNVKRLGLAKDRDLLRGYSEHKACASIPKHDHALPFAECHLGLDNQWLITRSATFAKCPLASESPEEHHKADDDHE
jgi:hypothetical protein